MIARYGKFEYVLAEHYRFEEELGRGAMGTVYRAQDVRLGRPVAIKMLHPMLTNELGVARFQSEIRIAAGLHHPNIIGVHDSGEADGRLYFVMDYLGGETLRDRLRREKQLSVEEALRITEQVADGLQYAHDHGVVHRDVKPENIILAEGRACVVDFGLARALGDVDTDRLTASGISVGTPHYLSPEQASAEKEVGPRADQYALACVLYEMLVGEPPFTGPTATSIAMRHISEEPRSLRVRRHTTPPSVEAAVMRAMEKVPADRFAGISEFAAFLSRPSAIQHVHSAVERELPASNRVVAGNVRTLSAKAIATLAVLLVVSLVVLGWSHFAKPRLLDPTKYLVTSVGPTDTVSRQVVRLLGRRFGEWQGLTLVDDNEGADAAPRATSILDQALKVARKHGARNVIALETDRRGDSVDVHARLYDAAGDTIVRQTQAVLAVADADSGRTMAGRRLVNALVRVGTELPWLDAKDRSNASLPAWQAYDAGRAAIREWSFADAEHSLRTALTADENLSLAHLWLAQTIAWSDTSRRDEGRASAVRSLARRSGLSARDSIHATGLLALFNREYPAACQSFQALVRRDSMDFAAWLDLGDCQASDKTIVSDNRAKNGYAFRTSFESAARAYRHAVTSAESSTKSSFRGWILGRLSSVLFAMTNRVRLGKFVSRDTVVMGGFPYLDADTVAFAPHPTADFQTRKGDPSPALVQAAASRARNDLKAYAEEWVRSAPRDAAAYDSLAMWSEVSGGFASVNGRQTPTLEVLRAARSLATDSSQQLRLAVSEVRILVKEGAFERARAKADSLLRSGAAAHYRDVAGIAGLMALLGHVHETSRLLPLARIEHRVQLANGRTWTPPRPVEEASASLLTYAVFGAFPDSVRALASRTSQLVASYVPDTTRANAIRSVLVAGAFGYGEPSDAIVPGFEFQPPDEVVRAVLLLSRGDTAGTRTQLRRLKEIDRGQLPGNGLRLAFRTATAWLAVGDTAEAVRQLDEMLRTLPLLDPAFLNEVSHVASAVRAFALRAQLAERLGDTRTAKADAGVVVALWSEADAELQPLVASMRAIVLSHR